MNRPQLSNFAWRDRYALIFITIVAATALNCGGCDDDRLHDISCKPGDPATGMHDPDLPELCTNFIDDNCNGEVNEGCECLDGQEFTCGTDIGECETRTVVCVEGKFPECEPRQSPRDELCDNIDNDCNGEIDDGLVPRECFTGSDSAILDGSTTCHSGMQYCEEGRWSECRDQSLPQPERCDTLDNDCDGIVDNDTETDGRACGPPIQTGQCQRGIEQCHDGESICVGAVWPQTEMCDSIDNDCDWQVDEDLFRPCATICGEGVEECSFGRWEDCSAPEPTVEVCDMLDNDCDGEIDEGCPCLPGMIVPCLEGMVDEFGDPITCGYGFMECQGNGEWGPCEFVGTTAETCNAWDDDCDGEIDLITAACGDPYTAGIGQCTLGVATCELGEWGDCEGMIGPEDELCDLIDNDCDGEIDEDLDPHDKVDMVFAIDISGSMCTYYLALAQGIGDYVASFTGTEHQFALAVFPGYGSSNTLTLNPNLTDVGTFVTAIANLNCNGGGSEPGYDVLLELSDPANPHGVNWREDAFPYIVYITDEPAQTWNFVTESSIASQMSNCGLPGCDPGDQVEIYIITNMNYYISYDDIVYNEIDRAFEINPAEHERYTEILRTVFKNVCVDGTEVVSGE